MTHMTIHKYNKLDQSFTFSQQGPKLWSVESNEMLSHLRHPTYPTTSNYTIPTFFDKKQFPSSKQQFQLQVFRNKFRLLASFGDPMPMRKSNPTCARSSLLRDHAIISKQHLRNLRFRAVNILEGSQFRYNQPKMLRLDTVIRNEHYIKLYLTPRLR